MNTLAWFLLSLTVGGSAQAQRLSSVSKTEISHTVLGGHVFDLEVARTPDQWQRGLSKRATLSKNQGMVFVLPTEQSLQFWMKDTLIPLDIIYFNSNGTFNTVHKNAPPCKLPKYTTSYCPTYSSVGNAQYVVELKGGTLDQLNIVPTTLRLSTKGL